MNEMNEMENLNEDLLNSAGSGDYELVYSLLNKGADPNFIGSDGATPLMRALSGYDTDSANLLIEYRADLNYKWNGMSPMDISISLNDFKSLKMLKGHQADSFEQSSLDLCNKLNTLESNSFSRLDDELHFAIEFNNTDNMPFLIEIGANVNSEDSDGKPALILAVENNAVEAAEILMKHKVNYNIKWEEKSLLQIAIDYNQKEMIDLIKSYIENEQLISVMDSENVLDSPSGIQFLQIMRIPLALPGRVKS